MNAMTFIMFHIIALRREQTIFFGFTFVQSLLAFRIFPLADIIAP